MILPLLPVLRVGGLNLSVDEKFKVRLAKWFGSAVVALLSEFTHGNG